MKTSINPNCICLSAIWVFITGVYLISGASPARGESASGDIVDTAVAAGGFETLLAAVEAAGLADTLKSRGPFTVFAPTDKAFERLPKGTLQSLLKPENREQLKGILTYHVVPGQVSAREAYGLNSAETANGQRLSITRRDGKLVIGNATIVTTDVNCSNGVIHVIDRVLLPQAMGPRQAKQMLEDAIRRGVPVFNRGDHGDCARIYTAACQAIVDSGSDQLSQNVMAALKTGLARAEQANDASSRAWALRRGIDSAWSLLRNATPVSTSTTVDTDRFLFTFDGPGAAGRWQTTNDGVMGGRSDGRFRINEDNNMEFFGTLSLENNGGFASVRSRGSSLGLKSGDSIVARVRGDGREYSLNLYTPARRMAFSYRAKFKTAMGEWTEVRIPVDSFVATSFGRVVRNQGLDPSEVNGLGILLGDKKAGPFKLEIDRIKVVKTN